jgi:ABC-type branched-subunit amino acid transport system ATPase component
MKHVEAERRPILEVQSLCLAFGGLQAVNDLSFEVEPGTITSLIGGNGAGKTTAFNLIAGNYRADSGQILFKGQRIDGLPPHKIARAGIARSFQELRLFNRLTAQDNILAAFPAQRGESLLFSLFGGAGLRAANRENETRSSALLEELTLGGHAGSLAEQLSYGQQKLLALGRLLAAEGELLLLDEPTSGLSPAMVDDFCERILQLVKTGKTILLIEHNVDIVLRLSDWVVVMHQGSKIAEGLPDDVRHNVAVMETYLGLG